MALQAARADAYVYWANANAGIGRANLDGTGPTQTFIPHSSTGNPDGVAVDGQHVYWADYGASRIGRANLDGSSPDLNWITTTGKPQGIAVDSGHVYWADVDNGAIGRANLDGTGVNQAFVDTGGGVTASGVDVDGGHIYWGDPLHRTVGRANLDGTAPTTAFISTPSGGPYDVAVDSSHVYWTGYFGNNIGRADLNGTNVSESFITGAALPSTVAVDSAHIYWTNTSNSSNSIGRANLDGSGVNQGLIATGTNPWGIAVDSGSAVVTPTLSTTASASVAIGNSISDSATLSNGSSPTGTITFKAYAPGDTSCSSAVFTSTKTVSGNGTYTSDNYTSAAVGTYRWIASYSGDANNADKSGACNDSGESVDVAKATPALGATAGPGGPIGTALTAAAALTGAHSPSGQVTYDVYGPDDATCANPPIFSDTRAVGAAVPSSNPFTPATAGTYRWVAHYSGDANNEAASSACNLAGQSAVISKAALKLAASSSPDAELGQSITDEATLTDGHSPTGQITFKAYGPGDAGCGNPPAFVDSAPVAGNGNYSSAQFTPTQPGIYRWVAAYSGDANNVAKSGACDDAGQSVTVTQVVPDKPTDAELQIISVALDRSNGTATLTVQANKDGSVQVVPTKRVAAGSPVDIAAAKTAELEVRAHGVAKRQLHRRGKVTVNPRVLLRLPGGGQIGKRQRLQLRFNR